MIRFDLGLERSDPSARWSSVQERLQWLTLQAAWSRSVHTLFSLRPARRFTISAITTLIALAIFDYIKGPFTGEPPPRSASRTVLIGGLAAAAAFMIARVIS